MSKLWCARRRTHATLVIVVMLAVLCAVFDWTWFRPLIQHHVFERSARRIDFDKLGLSLDASLRPTLHFQNLVVQNAPWASTQHPLIKAGEFDVTIAWESLRSDRLTIARMVIVDADLNLERQADGLRNWRVTRPDDRGLGKVRVLSLNAQRTRLRFVHRGIDLDIALQTSPLASPETNAAHPDIPMTNSVEWRGVRDSISFVGKARVSDVLTFSKTGEPFALRGELRTAHARLEVEGVANDLYELGGIDAMLHFTGSTLNDAALVASQAWPVPKGLRLLQADVAMHLTKSGPNWTATDLVARLGGSDLSGTLAYRVDPQLPILRASLHSRHIELAELRGLSAGANDEKQSLHQQIYASRELDGELNWSADAINLVGSTIDAVRVRAVLRDGRVVLAPLAFTMAGGHVSGRVSVDASHSPMSFNTDLRLDRLDLAKLGAKDLGGQLTLALSLRSQGDSLAMLEEAASGTVSGRVLRGSMPPALEAKLALDGGRWLRSMFSNQRSSAIVCAYLEMQFESGVGRLKRFAFETDAVAISGTGTVKLKNRAFDLKFTPHPKQSALLALDKSFYVSGTPAAFHVGLIERQEAAHGVCVE